MGEITLGAERMSLSAAMDQGQFLEGLEIPSASDSKAELKRKTEP